MQESFQPFFGFSLRHFDEVHVRQLLRKGHFTVLLQRRVQLFVYLLQNVVVMLPVRWVMGFGWGLKSLELGKETRKEPSIFEVY